MAVILFMGAVSGAHLNPAVTMSFALRGDFPWRRVPRYVIAQFVGAVLATLLLWALIGKQGSAGLTLPGPGISTWTAMLWEMVLTVGLVSTILGTASGAQQVGQIAAIGVGSYIALAGLFGGPVSGASMNPARSLGPALVLGDWNSWWAYLAGPLPAGSSRSASPTSCAARAAGKSAPGRLRGRWACYGAPGASAWPGPPRPDRRTRSPASRAMSPASQETSSPLYDDLADVAGFPKVTEGFGRVVKPE